MQEELQDLRQASPKTRRPDHEVGNEVVENREGNRQHEAEKKPDRTEHQGCD